MKNPTRISSDRWAVKEGGRNPPPYPSLFIKPSASVAGYKEDIPISKIVQDGTLDYEGELVGTPAAFHHLPQHTKRAAIVVSN